MGTGESKGNRRRVVIGLVLAVTLIGGLAVAVSAWSAADGVCDPTDGRDTFIGTGADETCDLGPGNDTLRGGDGRDTMKGGDGADEVRGGEFNDSDFGQGNVQLADDDDDAPGVYGGPGNDCDKASTNRKEGVYGEGGNDYVDDRDGSGDKDCLYGGGGNDVLNAVDGDGRDFLDGGSGSQDDCRGDDGDKFKNCESVNTITP